MNKQPMRCDACGKRLADLGGVWTREPPRKVTAYVERLCRCKTLTTYYLGE
jgi:phage FluMu protein Com